LSNTPPYAGDGSAVEGYVANLRPHSLRLWTKGSTALREIALDDVRRVALTGRDPAAGQSFATWQRSHDGPLAVD
jgi:hypothetical protein